jgi:hypothetical protein
MGGKDVNDDDVTELNPNSAVNNGLSDFNKKNKEILKNSEIRIDCSVDKT